MANTPNIRFKGFEEDWEQRKLGEVCERVTRKNKDGVSDLPLTISSQYGLIDQRNFFNKVVAAKDMSNYFLLKKGEFAYNKSYSNGFAYGSIKRLNAYETGCLSTLYICFSLMDDDVDSDFLECYFDTLQWYSDVSQICAEGARNHGLLNVDTKAFFTDVRIKIPKSVEEQKQIALYLNTLDNLITLHQRKCDETKELKKYMLQKMFPKNGEIVPEIRFEGFTDPWEQRKFKELYKRSGEKNDGSIGIDKNITVASMKYKNDIQVSSTDYLKTYYTFKVGDIAFEGHQSKDFRFGRFVENDIGDGIVSHIFTVFRPIVEYDLYFWKYAINNENLMQRVLARSTKASTMMHDLVASDFLNESFKVPCILEQNKIGSYFKNLDNLITLHQRKCDELKEIKKYMLQNMFV